MSTQTPDRLTGAGYPEPRVPLEVQSWWDEPGIAESMHLHAFTCFPLAQTVKGIMRLDVRVMLHENPGTLIALSTDVYVGDDLYTNIPDVKCTDPSGLCEYWYTVNIDTRRSSDGWHELRLKPRVKFPAAFDTDPGATQITSSGWPFRIDNGSHSNGGNRSECANATGECQVQFRGWYEHNGYANVAPLQARDFNPMPTWSGASHASRWRIYNNAPNGEDKKLTYAAAYVDPDFHNPAYVANPFWKHTGPFPWKGTLNVPLTGLANGSHRLVVQAMAEVPTGTPGKLSGLGVVRFNVAN